MRRQELYHAGVRSTMGAEERDQNNYQASAGTSQHTPIKIPLQQVHVKCLLPFAPVHVEDVGCGGRKGNN